MKIFISYTSADRELAEHLARDLRAHGVAVDLPESFISVGDSLTERIVSELSDSDAVVVLISKDYDRSMWAELELAVAVYQREMGHLKHILPVLTSSDAVVPPLLVGVLYLNAATEQYEDVVHKILGRLYAVEPRPQEPRKSDLDWLTEQANAIAASRHFELSRRTLQRTLQPSLFLSLGIASLLAGVLAATAALAVNHKVSSDWTGAITTIFCPLLAFSLGYYFREGKESRRDRNEGVTLRLRGE